MVAADTANNRLEEFTLARGAVETLGWNVNRTKDTRGVASQMERDVCTVGSGDVCTAGATGVALGHLNYPGSVAIDQLTGAIYVSEVALDEDRIDKYTADGRFAWMIGKGVNLPDGGNRCTLGNEVRTAKCGAGLPAQDLALEHGAFKLAQFDGDLVAVGGPEELVYVGDEHRVQEFYPDGKWRGEILLASLSGAKGSHVAALGVSREGDLYLVYSATTSGFGVSTRDENVVHEFGPDGLQVSEFTVDANRPGAVVSINGIAVDSVGRVAVIGLEVGGAALGHAGIVYDGGSGQPVATFVPPTDNDGIAFDQAGDLYVAATDDEEIVMYKPVPAMQLVTSPTNCPTASAGSCGCLDMCVPLV